MASLGYDQIRKNGKSSGRSDAAPAESGCGPAVFAKTGVRSWDVMGRMGKIGSHRGAGKGMFKMQNAKPELLSKPWFSVRPRQAHGSMLTSLRTHQLMSS
jgi:hypothetical protein